MIQLGLLWTNQCIRSFDKQETYTAEHLYKCFPMKDIQCSCVARVSHKVICTRVSDVHGSCTVDSQLLWTSLLNNSCVFSQCLLPMTTHSGLIAHVITPPKLFVRPVAYHAAQCPVGITLLQKLTLRGLFLIIFVIVFGCFCLLAL